MMNCFERNIQEYNERNLCARRIRLERLKHIGSNGVLTQQELAERICSQGYPMTRITVSRIESGIREITDFDLIQFAYALNIDVRYLLCGSKTVGEMVVECGEAFKNNMRAGA